MVTHLIAKAKITKDHKQESTLNIVIDEEKENYLNAKTIKITCIF